MGLIVYELITNAVRHAFHGRNGEIRVELLRAGAFVHCKVMDNGSAPAHVQRGHGLKIIEELVKALDGRFEQRFGTAGCDVSSSFSAQSDSFATMAITQDLSQYLSHLMGRDVVPVLIRRGSDNPFDLLQKWKNGNEYIFLDTKDEIRELASFLKAEETDGEKSTHFYFTKDADAGLQNANQHSS